MYVFRVSTKLSWDKNIKKGIFLNTLNVRISGPVSYPIRGILSKQTETQKLKMVTRNTRQTTTPV